MATSRGGRWLAALLFGSGVALLFLLASSRSHSGGSFNIPVPSLPFNASRVFKPTTTTATATTTTSGQEQGERPSWLLAIFVSPSELRKRDVIRATWIARFANSTPFEYRFIMGNFSASAKPDVVAEVLAENATHGDIWALPEFTNEDYWTANQQKTMELFKFLAKEQGKSIGRYEFVSKVDSDIWINLPVYYETFMASRLPGGNNYDPEAKIIMGRPMSWGAPFCYASGRMYTLSWKLIEHLATKYEANPILNKPEDRLTGLYLYEDELEHEFVILEAEQAYDLGIEGIVDDRNPTVLIHKIKDLKRMLLISTIFDERGRWNGLHLEGVTTWDRTMPEVIERIGGPDDDEKQKLEEGPRWRASTKLDLEDTIDFKLIRDKVGFENRVDLGNMFPLYLPGNNESSGIVPQQL